MNILLARLSELCAFIGFFTSLVSRLSAPYIRSRTDFTSNFRTQNDPPQRTDAQWRKWKSLSFKFETLGNNLAFIFFEMTQKFIKQESVGYALKIYSESHSCFFFCRGRATVNGRVKGAIVLGRIATKYGSFRDTPPAGSEYLPFVQLNIYESLLVKMLKSSKRRLGLRFKYSKYSIEKVFVGSSAFL